MKRKISSTISFLSVFLLFECSLLLSGIAAPTELVTAYGSEFSLNGIAYRFVGVNLRGISHYGHGDPLPYTNSGHIDENLAGVASMGGKVVRLFAAVNNASHQDVVNRLKVVLDKMEPLGLKAIVCFTDVYPTAFHPQGDDGYYQLQPNGWTLLDDSWFSSGYTINYLPFVQLAVTQLKDHNAVFAWELGNELTDIKNPDNIISFTANVAASIKAIDPYHMVTTGYLSVDHLQIGETKGYQLYADPNLNFITYHTYSGDDHYQNWAVHSRLGKPLVVEEYGWDAAHGDRVTNTQAQLEKWMDVRAARGFMQWGYQAQSYDIGDGDNIFGMDQYAHSDYSQLFSLYSTRATQIENNPVVLPSRLTPQGTNVALNSVAWQADSIFSSSYGGEKAYDGVVSAASKWTSQGTAPPHWLALDLGQHRSLDGFSIRMAGAAHEYVYYNFPSFEIQSGSSLSGPWSTEFDMSNSAQFSFVHCLYDTPKMLRYLRLYVTDCGIDNYCRLPEFEAYETQAATMEWWLFY